MEALISLLDWAALESVSVGCGHHGCEHSQSRYGHSELAHCISSFNLRLLQDATFAGQKSH
jgi:hypothetical protein